MRTLFCRTTALKKNRASWGVSSAVEQLAFNQLVEGSIPSLRTIFTHETRSDKEGHNSLPLEGLHGLGDDRAAHQHFIAVHGADERLIGLIERLVAHPFTTHGEETEELDERKEKQELGQRGTLHTVDVRAGRGETCIEQGMRHIEPRHGIDVAAGRIEGAVLHWKRAEEVPESEPQETQARIEVQDVRCAQDAHAAGLQHSMNLPHHLAEVLQMLDHLCGGHDIEGGIGIGQGLVIQIGDVHPLAGDLHERIGVVTGARFDTEFGFHLRDERAAAGTDVQIHPPRSVGGFGEKKFDDFFVDTVNAHAGGVLIECLPPGQPFFSSQIVGKRNSRLEASPNAGFS